MANDVGTRIMNEHGIYPLLDTRANDALLPTVCGDDRNAEQVDLYADTKGLHLVWRPVKRDKNGDAVWNGGTLLMETKSVDVTAGFAAKLDYDGEAPDFSDMAKTNNDETWFAAAPEFKDSYMFTLCALKDDKGTHLSHIFATDGHHCTILLAPDAGTQTAALEHTGVATLISSIPSDCIDVSETYAYILSKAKELLK